jgi:hypothetical protein
MEKGGQMSAKLPTDIPTLQRLGIENFTDAEIAVLTTRQTRGKPTTLAAAAREKFHKLYIAAESKEVRAKVAALSPESALKETKAMFREMMNEAKSVVDGDSFGFVVAGAPGIGKTYSLESYLEQKLNAREQMRFRKIPAGNMTPINLYITLYRNRYKGQVLLIDDNDGILEDSAALNLLKGALDTGRTRRIAWMSESSALKGDDEAGDIPKEFEFEGSVIFISNMNITAMMQSDKHLNAVMDRMTYIDLKLHERRQVMEWVVDGIRNTGILEIYFKANGNSKWKESYSKDVAAFIAKHGMSLRSLSYRGAIRIAQKRMLNPTDWEASALRTERI